MPRVTTRKRSASVGGSPEPVVRSLNEPSVKSRGRGSRSGATGPPPSPFSPWQARQRFTYIRRPGSAASGAPAGRQGLPALLVGEVVPPGRHRRVPRRGLRRQARAALGDAPVRVRLHDGRDRAGVGEARGLEREPTGGRARAVGGVAV